MRRSSSASMLGAVPPAGETETLKIPGMSTAGSVAAKASERGSAASQHGGGKAKKPGDDTPDDLWDFNEVLAGNVGPTQISVAPLG